MATMKTQANMDAGILDEDLIPTDEVEIDSDKRIAEIINEDEESGKHRWRDYSEDVKEHYKLWKGSPLGNESDDRCSIVSRDVMSTIEWKMPPLLKLLTSENKIVSISPVGASDDEKADIVSRLLNYQFFNGNNGMVFLYKWIKGAEIFGNYFAKSRWGEKYQQVPFYYPEMDEAQFEALMQETKESSADAIVTAEVDAFESEAVFDPMSGAETTTYKNITGKRTTYTYRGPIVELVPFEDVVFDPVADSLESAEWVAHYTYKTLDECYALQEQGIYKNVEKLETEMRNNTDERESAKAEKAYDAGESTYTLSRQESSSQLGRKMVLILEYWGNVDIDDSGRTKPWLAVRGGKSVILRNEPNPYWFGAHPFDDLRPNIDPEHWRGIGIGEMVGPYQKTKTAITRQIIDNGSFQLNGLWEVERDSNPDYDVLMNPIPGGCVRVDKVGGIKTLVQSPLSPHGMQLYEFVQSSLETLTGQTRYNQGTDASSLNKTASGITQIMQRSDQRNWLEALLMANGGLKSMFSKWMMMNQQYLPEKYAFRLLEQPYEVSRDDIQGAYDLSIKVGSTEAEDAQKMQSLMGLLQMAPQMQQWGVMGPDQVYQILTDFIETVMRPKAGEYTSNPNYTLGLKKKLEEVQEIIQALITQKVITPEQLQVVVQRHRKMQEANAQMGALQGGIANDQQQ